MFYVGLFVVLCEPCCYHPLLVVAVTLSVYDGCVAGGGRPGMPGGLGPGRVTEQSTHPARPETQSSYSWLAGRGGGSSGLSLGLGLSQPPAPGHGGQDLGHRHGLVILHSQDPDQDMVTL